MERIINHERTLQTRRILQPDLYSRKISLYWAINARLIVERFLARYFVRTV